MKKIIVVIVLLILLISFFYPKKAFVMSHDNVCHLEKKCQCLGIIKKGFCPYPCFGGSCSWCSGIPFNCN